MTNVNVRVKDFRDKTAQGQALILAALMEDAVDLIDSLNDLDLELVRQGCIDHGMGVRETDIAIETMTALRSVVEDGNTRLEALEADR